MERLSDDDLRGIVSHILSMPRVRSMQYALWFSSTSAWIHRALRDASSAWPGVSAVRDALRAHIVAKSRLRDYLLWLGDDPRVHFEVMRSIWLTDDCDQDTLRRRLHHDHLSSDTVWHRELRKVKHLKMCYKRDRTLSPADGLVLLAEIEMHMLQALSEDEARVRDRVARQRANQPRITAFFCAL